jgi:hypothetical protein
MLRSSLRLHLFVVLLPEHDGQVAWATCCGSAPRPGPLELLAVSSDLWLLLLASPVNILHLLVFELQCSFGFVSQPRAAQRTAMLQQLRLLLRVVDRA